MKIIKHCILIQCHRLNNSLIYNLNKFKDNNDVVVIIHVDKKVDIEEFLFLESDNVKFVENRFSVSWGSVSQILLTIELLKYSIKEGFEYVTFISGDDVFIKSIDQFSQFIRNNIEKEFIGFTNGDFSSRYEYIHYDCFFERKGFINRLKRKFYKVAFSLGLLKNKRVKPFKKFYKGSNWFTLSISCVTYILKRIHDEPQVIDYFKNSFCCDEVFFHSIIANSPYYDSLYSKNFNDNKASLRYIDWETGPDYPKILSFSDLDSNFDDDVFFIRKVGDDISIDFLKNRFG
ncbi:beta-1,6-N-acetylglucosaminyltransferase [Photobacterium angustum]|uniref:Peptide O-xylosyltransferase n=1 Tax=Photobacterium angustum TaxID=661 RepID=A0A2S7VW64_PHOAN|nr:beta-1,6-N-acetylglucosaminyltransferase [Photobacterium angustum]PQJ66356.1 hypothetical protein BTO08_02435 [Photobacterium angustum]